MICVSSDLGFSMPFCPTSIIPVHSFRIDLCARQWGRDAAVSTQPGPWPQGVYRPELRQMPQCERPGASASPFFLQDVQNERKRRSLFRSQSMDGHKIAVWIKNRNLILAKMLLHGKGATGWRVVIMAADLSRKRKALGVLPLCPLTSDP